MELLGWPRVSKDPELEHRGYPELWILQRADLQSYGYAESRMALDMLFARSLGCPDGHSYEYAYRASINYGHSGLIYPELWGLWPRFYKEYIEFSEISVIQMRESCRQSEASRCAHTLPHGVEGDWGVRNIRGTCTV